MDKYFNKDSNVGKVWKKEMLPTGILRVWCSVSKVGDLSYYNADGSTRIEHLDATELLNPDSLNTLWSCPITLLHPPVQVDSNNISKHIVGVTQQTLNTDGQILSIVSSIFDSKTINYIQNEECQVSAGYSTVMVKKDGKLHQTKRKYNHIAILPTSLALGRAGASVKVLA